MINYVTYTSPLFISRLFLSFQAQTLCPIKTHSLFTFPKSLVTSVLFYIFIFQVLYKSKASAVKMAQQIKILTNNCYDLSLLPIWRQPTVCYCLCVHTQTNKCLKSGSIQYSFVSVFHLAQCFNIHICNVCEYYLIRSYYIFFVHLLFGGHISCFQLWAVVNNDTVNIRYKNISEYLLSQIF